MLVKPNKTILRARVRAVRPERDGPGRELDLDVTENRTHKADEDFLKPQPGASLTLYSTESDPLAPGDLIEVEATLLAGPFGERAVTQRVKRLGKPRS